jgi:hypothetical protein
VIQKHSGILASVFDLDSGPNLTWFDRLSVTSDHLTVATSKVVETSRPHFSLASGAKWTWTRPPIGTR